MQAYEVRRDGAVMGKRGRPLTQQTKGSGYAHVAIDGHYVAVHRLVAAEFIGDVEGMEVHHINGDKLDNRVENLQIVSRTEHVWGEQGAEGIRRIRAGLALGVPIEAYLVVGYTRSQIEMLRAGTTYADAPGPISYKPTAKTDQMRVEFSELREQGLTRGEIAEMYGCSKRTVSRYWKEG